jgi:hypothetical protein
MLRPLTLLLLAAAPWLSGCMAFAPILPNDSSILAETARTGPTVYGMDDFVADEPPLPDFSYELMRYEVDKTLSSTPCGSRIKVYVVPRGQRGFTGTLVRKTADEIELMNCIWIDAVPGPGGHAQVRTSHVPMRMIPLSEMVRIDVLDPPPPGFAPPDLDEDPYDIMIEKIVYRSGKKSTLYPKTVPRGATLDPDHPPEPGSVRFFGDPEP